MKKFGLIGQPVAHSLSPALFKAAYGGRYTYSLIDEDSFEHSFTTFLQKFDGINVTAPYKEAAAARADAYTGEVSLIGAANVLIKNEELITAYNTDIQGVEGVLKSIPSLIAPGRKALVIGCGGAGKAAVYAMLVNGLDVSIVNRNLVKACDFAAAMQRKFPERRIEAKPLESLASEYREADFIIYTLPLSVPEMENLYDSEVCGQSKERTILEANYRNPAFTASLIEKMREREPLLNYVSGKEWLLHQAIAAFRIFTGEEPNKEAMRKVL